MPKPIAARLPYLLHTNRELGLMLSGNKPLAVFADAKGRFASSVQRYIRCFDRQVAIGKFVRRDHFSDRSPTRDYILHTVMFALPAEEWRIDAMLDLRSSPGWSLHHERREGELLEYEEWMNDYHLSLRYGVQK